MVPYHDVGFYQHICQLFYWGKSHTQVIASLAGWGDKTPVTPFRASHVTYFLLHYLVSSAFCCSSNFQANLCISWTWITPKIYEERIGIWHSDLFLLVATVDSPLCTHWMIYYLNCIMKCQYYHENIHQCVIPSLCPFDMSNNNKFWSKLLHIYIVYLIDSEWPPC